jgi:hypothetical protein
MARVSYIAGECRTGVLSLCSSGPCIASGDEVNRAHDRICLHIASTSLRPRAEVIHSMAFKPTNSSECLT